MEGVVLSGVDVVAALVATGIATVVSSSEVAQLEI